jgi:hypothetical protein
MAPNFCEYFVKKHIEIRGNWFEGFAPGFLNKNNGLEAKNNIIKKWNLPGQIINKRFIK